MKPETLELQKMIEPGCGRAIDLIKFPVAVKSRTGKFKWLVLSETIEVVINEWCVQAIGLDRLQSGEGTEIPIINLIAELKSIIAELEK